MTSTESEFVTKREAAGILRVSTRTVDRYADEGRLTKHHASARLCLFVRAEVVALVRGQESGDSPGPRGHEAALTPDPIRGRAFGPAGG